MIILSDDAQHVTYFGLDAQFTPFNLHEFEAHTMVNTNGTVNLGYRDRITAIVKTYDSGIVKSYPVMTTGFTDGSFCVSSDILGADLACVQALFILQFSELIFNPKSKDVECASGKCGKAPDSSFYQCLGSSCKTDIDCGTKRCRYDVCVPKLGACQVCEQHFDCESGICSSLFRCSGEKGLMDDECVCVYNSDCRSARCEGLKSRICEAKLSEGAYCNESQDCVSGYCSWKFRCDKWGSQTFAAFMGASMMHFAEFDDTNRGATRPEEEVFMLDIGGNGCKPLIAIIAAAFFIIALGRWFYQRQRRHGYEQVPVELVV